MISFEWVILRFSWVSLRFIGSFLVFHIFFILLGFYRLYSFGCSSVISIYFTFSLLLFWVQFFLYYFLLLALSGFYSMFLPCLITLYITVLGFRGWHWVIIEFLPSFFYVGLQETRASRRPRRRRRRRRRRSCRSTARPRPKRKSAASSDSFSTRTRRRRSVILFFGSSFTKRCLFDLVLPGFS